MKLCTVVLCLALVDASFVRVHLVARPVARVTDLDPSYLNSVVSRYAGLD